MSKHIAIIQGNPDPSGKHYGNALADAYQQGAKEAGHEVQIINVAQLKFPLLQTKEDFEKGVPPDSIELSQETILWADHLLIIYPLWLGDMPALLKGFFEQVLRPRFVTGEDKQMTPWNSRLRGKTARVVVTMGMPAFFYRWFFREHSLKNLRRGILKFCGIGPIKENIIGAVEAKDGRAREKWLKKMNQLGHQCG
ncbi:MAG TPA: NAD(P)H-dependent oxidoreductase [Blastocatellia bacterium]|nr:NAD(P)H-dependent oxidoreductase [Blastocatellia bacterium]